MATVRLTRSAHGDAVSEDGEDVSEQGEAVSEPEWTQSTKDHGVATVRLTRSAHGESVSEHGANELRTALADTVVGGDDSGCGGDDSRAGVDVPRHGADNSLRAIRPSSPPRLPVEIIGRSSSSPPRPQNPTRHSTAPPPSKPGRGERETCPALHISRPPRPHSWLSTGLISRTVCVPSRVASLGPPSRPSPHGSGGKGRFRRRSPRIGPRASRAFLRADGPRRRWWGEGRDGGSKGGRRTWCAR